MTLTDQLALIAVMCDPGDDTVLPGMDHARDFSGFDLSDWPAELFDDVTIINATFYCENSPYRQVFPEGCKATFERCNLDNVKLPGGCKVGADCCNKQLRCFPPTPKNTKAKDGLPEGAIDWLVDEAGKPIKPFDRRQFVGVDAATKSETVIRSLDPADIPEEHVIREVFTQSELAALHDADFQAETAKGSKPLRGKAAWFKGVPKIISTNTTTDTIELPTKEWRKWQMLRRWGHFDSEPKNITPLVHKAGTVTLRGSVTRHKAEGPAWLHRGETEADVIARKQVLADVRARAVEPEAVK